MLVGQTVGQQVLLGGQAAAGELGPSHEHVGAVAALAPPVGSLIAIVLLIDTVELD